MSVVLCLNQLCKYSTFPHCTQSVQTLEWGIAGEESSRKSSRCLREPRAHTTHPLKLSAAAAGPFINLGTDQKYAKAHHSLNSHISPNYIPPKLAAKKTLTNRANLSESTYSSQVLEGRRKI